MKLQVYTTDGLDDYLEGHTFTVYLNDSTPKPTPSSLLQGAVLSTTLNSFYLSDMPRPLCTHYTLYMQTYYPFSLSPGVLLQTRYCCNDLTQILHYMEIRNKYPQNWYYSICQAPPPPSGSTSKPWHLCALGLGSPLFRPCTRLTTSLHPTLAHHRQQSHSRSL